MNSLTTFLSLCILLLLKRRPYRFARILFIRASVVLSLQYPLITNSLIAHQTLLEDHSVKSLQMNEGLGDQVVLRRACDQCAQGTLVRRTNRQLSTIEQPHINSRHHPKYWSKRGFPYYMINSILNLDCM